MKRGMLIAFSIGAGGGAALLAIGGSQGGSGGPTLPPIGNDPMALSAAELGCRQSDDIERLGEYQVQKDNAAWDTALNTYLGEGECHIFSGGSTIYVTDTSAWHNQMKFRAVGDTDQYWGRPVGLSKAPG